MSTSVAENHDTYAVPDNHDTYDKYFDELYEQHLPLSEGQFQSIGLMVMDAALVGDIPKLATAYEGMQWLYADRQGSTGDVEQARLTGMLDVARVGLRRLGAMPPKES